MAQNSSIEWTEATWNPVAGCSILSPGCTNCYAMRMAHRLDAIGQPKYKGLTRKTGGRAKWTGRIRLDETALDIPRKWKRGRTIFVNSMSDLFHDDVPLEFIRDVFRVMRETPHHTYQVLTKRAERLSEIARHLEWSGNIWMGVSIENAAYVGRAEHLLRTQAAVKFLSLEPLLGPLDELDFGGIDWVIAGGESGPGSRPLDPDWIRSIRDRCRKQKVAFHFKQWGGVNKKRTGRLLDGRYWDELPRNRAIAGSAVA
jgi:protein gp37